VRDQAANRKSGSRLADRERQVILGIKRSQLVKLALEGSLGAIASPENTVGAASQFHRLNPGLSINPIDRPIVSIAQGLALADIIGLFRTVLGFFCPLEEKES